ncbi:HTH-type transcriptional activator RhaR [Pseudoalteromonas holothuriae]|uniref:HTH-type transcriptional activator RhaR n=1 Tax=Pseudoalteromonas holothuriae TaxID=2963714 RepID=A0ABM9GJM0_9GAMM|nr:AraC family transcriptional regulator [Pseudoalteromonas sp. CIP111951]CAH9061788.1 HTH-type transcriptional activator RhaR [Pseudoalteromonas sp. CIP111951]
MQTLQALLEQIKSADRPQPFSVYHSYFEQKLLDVPITKPLLIIILQGSKALGHTQQMYCQQQFIFLANSLNIDMRNIPDNDAYHALLIEFEPSDFDVFTGYQSVTKEVSYFSGQVCARFESCLTQFIQSSLWASNDIFTMRKREILWFLKELGFNDVLSIKPHTSLGHKVHELLQQSPQLHMSVSQLCRTLAMSESSLRRKLKFEGTSIQIIKDRTRMAQGLHLLQTKQYTIGHVASLCGFDSQSKFTEKFKKHFGLTPSALLRTKMKD